MHNVVDVVGIDAISKMIEQSKLCRFKIYKETDGKGSTPTFESINTSQNGKAVGAFKSWAKTIVSNNPYNSQVYDIFLYNKTDDCETGVGDDDEDHISKKKKNKIRFTFALVDSNPYPGQTHVSGQQFPDVGEAVNDAVNKERERVASEKVLDELKDLKEEMREMKEEKDVGADEPTPEPEKEDEGPTFKDFADSIKNVRDILKDLGNRETSVAGDDDNEGLDEEVVSLVQQQDAEDVEYEEVDETIDDTGTEDDDSLEEDESDSDDDSDDSEVDEETPAEEPEQESKYTEEQQAGIDEKRKRIAAALKVLLKHNKNIDKDLMRLAQMAQKNPEMFKMAVGTLRNMKF